MKLLEVKAEFCINEAWGSIFNETCIRPNFVSMINVVPCSWSVLKKTIQLNLSRILFWRWGSATTVKPFVIWPKATQKYVKTSNFVRLNKNSNGLSFSAIRRRENGWYDEEHPLVFLFLGSSGIGKHYSWFSVVWS